MNANLNWLTDPTVFQINRLPAHSDHVCYASLKECGQNQTSLRQSLDGPWRFVRSPAPAMRPEDFWQEGYDDSAFETIQVPGHIELQGYGQIQYINTLYPWDGHSELRPPQIDLDADPVGSYVREFDLEPGLSGQRVCISFQGVEQAFYVWLNGHFIGYGEDSFTPSDFDLTPHIRQRGNRLCVEVYKLSSAAWIEDQDFFRFSGIFRSVFLYAKPRLHLEDLWLKAALCDSQKADGAPDLQKDTQTQITEPVCPGTLSLRLLLSGETDGSRVHCHLSKGEEAVLFDGPLDLYEKDGYLWGTLHLPRIHPWSHETPRLYRVTLTLKTADGQTAEVIPYEIGFRRLELRDGVILLNGKRLLLNGVNRHEWSPERGRAVTAEDMDAAMEVFNRNHINAVRTCHYPNQTPWYHMCDREGIYMIDEANLESHGSWQKLGKVEPSWNVPGNRKEWRECVLDRARSMFERDKNHVSILFWSCGNESYAGEDILAMAEYFRRQDDSRLVHYEGVFHNREYDRISDVESRMYAPPSDVRAYLEKGSGKPFLLCEYMHDMGNSLGGMESYVRLGDEFDSYQGGFIWDYMDQALWRTDACGRRTLGYGGDFGERQSDYAFSGNGIVFADGTEKPAMQEVRYWYADPARRAAHDERNRLAREGTLRQMREDRGGGAQGSLPCGRPSSQAAPALRVTHGDGALGVRGEDFEILFSYPEGGPVSLKARGQEWLWRAPRPAYWRAATENDRGNGFALQSSVWAAADSWQQCNEIRILGESRERVRICYVYTATVIPDLRTEVTYTVSSDGSMTADIHYHGKSGRPELPLLGLRFATPEPAQTVGWLGLSGETYPDRKKGGVFGWHEEAPHIPAYLVPQECGCHSDTMRALLKTGQARLCMEMCETPFFFSAIPYTPQQLEQAAHREELPRPVRTVVTLCGAMRGVGGIDSWGSDVEEAYRVSAEEDIRFRLRFTWQGTDPRAPYME
ncbi:MAG: beta-galactosidase [Lachnospiraceae bacterium]|jgi:beta-galactosidase/beta-glucuronidase|nr:beta-galactosidase [Lachnospiraceae bacterium]